MTWRMENNKHPHIAEPGRALPMRAFSSAVCIIFHPLCISRLPPPAIDRTLLLRSSSGQMCCWSDVLTMLIQRLPLLELEAHGILSAAITPQSSLLRLVLATSGVDASVGRCRPQGCLCLIHSPPVAFILCILSFTGVYC